MINEIKKEGNIYIIEAQNADSICLILTKFNPFYSIIPSSEARSIIEIGKAYPLLLKRYFPSDTKMIYYHFDGIGYNNTFIPIKPGEIYYTTENLDGLFLVSDNEIHEK